jgi:hypothetical protein
LGEIEVDNSGLVHAYGFVAAGILAVSEGDALVAVQNSGEIIADGAYAIGIQVRTLGDINIVNDGTIAAYGGTYGTGISAATDHGALYITNTGGIEVVAGDATGISASGGGSIDVLNSGEIVADSAYASAVGISVFGSFGDTYVGNAGSLSVYGGYAQGLSVRASGYAANAISNSGSILAVGDKGATGIFILSGGDADIDNAGTIAATGGIYATGIEASSFGRSDVSVSNSGSIEVDALTSVGISVGSRGDASVVNSGQIDALGTHGYAGGIFASSEGTLVVDNSGTIDAASAYDRAVGIHVFLSGNGGGSASIYNSGDIHVAGVDHAWGIFAGANSGDIYAYNAGTIDVYSGSSLAVGILLSAKYGDVAVVNLGDVAAASGGFGAAGIYAFASEDRAIDIANGGSIVRKQW